MIRRAFAWGYWNRKGIGLGGVTLAIALGGVGGIGRATEVALLVGRVSFFYRFFSASAYLARTSANTLGAIL